MKLDQAGYNLIKSFEGLRLRAYQDAVGIYTIGYGNITYENGKKVQRGDVITRERADELFRYFADKFASNVDASITVPVTQNQFNALVSFAYNVGIGAFRKSTLLKKLNKCTNDPTIRNEFLKWVNAGGRRLEGLVKRRTREAELYFKKE